MAKRRQRKSERVKSPQVEMSEAMILRKKSRQRRRRRFFGILFTIILCAGLFYVSGLDYFIIDDITVSGNEHYTDVQIIKKANAKTGVNMFRILLSKWEDDLEKDPYISDAIVKRKLPDGAGIKVTEREEKYAVSYGQRFVITDEEGIALRLADTTQEYITIDGVTLKEVTLGQKIQDESKLQNVDKAITAIEELTGKGVPLKKITMEDLFVTVQIYDKLVFKTEYGMLAVNIENLKAILADLDNRNIQRGTIKGQDGDLAFSPQIE